MTLGLTNKLIVRKDLSRKQLPLPAIHDHLPRTTADCRDRVPLPERAQIRCQAIQAGKAAKCPRCGVKFRVPEATKENIPKLGDSDSNVLHPEFTESSLTGLRMPNTANVAAKEPQFEFLCPNGHRLHGPVSLQGRPGECPDCGSRFRVPTYEDIPAGEQIEQEIGRGRANGHEGSEIAEPATTFPAKSSALAQARSRKRRPRRRARCGGDDCRCHSDFGCPTWDMRPKGATVELRLRSGETITPDQFLASASRESRQGIFTTIEADATVSLVVRARGCRGPDHRSRAKGSAQGIGRIGYRPLVDRPR